MFGRLMPRQGKFFDLFNEHAEQIVLGSRELAALMANLDDLERRTYNIESIEKRADKITRTHDRTAAQDLHHAARPRRHPPADHARWTTSST